MKIKDILNQVKASKNTYYNLDKKSIQDYKKLYNYLKKHSEKSFFLAAHNSFYHWINKKNKLEYVKKYNAMQCISTCIIH